MESPCDPLPYNHDQEQVHRFFQEALLGWYEGARRVLPWRSGSGERADPYRVWLSEIMLQQTTVAAVISYFQKFVEQWPTVCALARTPREEVLSAWAGLGYYARARNLHACAQVVCETLGGRFPATVEGLRALPGIGEYTAGAIAAIAFGLPAVALDGNGERVVARYFDIVEPFPAGKKTVRRTALPLFTSVPQVKAGDFVQAVMDLGATICTPKNPRCFLCPLSPQCRGFASGRAVALPFRSAPPYRPRRRGRVYLITDSRGRILVHRRAETGLLGGMIGLPGSVWEEEDPPHPPWLKQAGWEGLIGEDAAEISHTFTHFHLSLKCYRLRVEAAVELPQEFIWQENMDEAAVAMPSVFRKAFKALRLQS